jgi:hypothetical protein
MHRWIWRACGWQKYVASMNHRLWKVYIQGCGCTLFNPEIASKQIVSEDDSAYLFCTGNLSITAINNFIGKHTCNLYCQLFDLPELSVYIANLVQSVYIMIWYINSYHIYSFMHVDTDETFICFFFHLKHCIVELELNVHVKLKSNNAKCYTFLFFVY